MDETRIQDCRDCDGTGEQIDLTAPDGMTDCRACRGRAQRRVVVSRPERELVAA